MVHINEHVNVKTHELENEYFTAVAYGKSEKIIQ